MKRTQIDARDAGSLTDAIQQALGLHSRGDLLEAQRRYRAILGLRPEQFDVLHALGVLEMQQGRLEEARRLIRKALKVRPAAAEAHLNLGNVLKALGRPDAALTSYERALAIQTDYAAALNNRGNLLLELGRHAAALASYERALAIQPDAGDARYNRAVVLQKIGRHEDALADYERVLSMTPDHAEALINRGNALQDLERHEEALASYDLALVIAPQATAYNNRGNALRSLGRHADALASYQRAIEVDPGYAEVYFNLGVFFEELGRYAEALECYGKALAISPHHVGALYMRGLALQKQQRHEQAIADFRQVLKLDGGDVSFAAARGHLLQSRLRICDWHELEREVTRITALLKAGKCSIPPLEFMAISHSMHDQRQCARAWIAGGSPGSPSPLWNGERYRHDRIRIAYLSSDLRAHAVAQLMAELFERHDRTRFEITALSFGGDAGGEMRTRLTRAFEHFIDVREHSDLEVAQLMREREIDIAVDLNGHTQDSRAGIFVLRPAPVHVNYLGYPGTLGADYIDYMIADRFVVPEQNHTGYSENIVCMPDTFQANDTRRRIAECLLTRAEAGLPENGMVYCAFNRGYKITPSQFEVWMRLLRRVEGSVLWLVRDSASVEHNLRREAAQRGVAPQRLVFAPWIPYADHLARYRLADLFLDTLPFNAGTTASDALWAGLPVLTCPGEPFAARMAGSLLHAVGLPELIAPTMHDYEALAVQLAMEPALLATIREKLARNRLTYPLFDTDRFRRHIEAAYTTMWQRSQRGEPPASFAVAAQN